MSGVSAAKRLKELGYNNFQIIEGSSRSGGRLKHDDLNGFKVEMGNLHVIGGGSNPILAMLEKFNVSYQAADYDDWVVRATNGTNVTAEADAIYEDRFEPALETHDANADIARAENRPDYTLRSALLKGNWSPDSNLDNVIEYFDIDWVYGYDPGEVSGKYAFVSESVEEFGSDEEFVNIDDRGYADILQSELNEIIGNNTEMLKLNKVVSNIVETDGEITVSTASGETYTADYVIVTFSVGVLQSKQVMFTPELPEWKMDAIQQFQMAQYTNVYVQFSSSFWDDNEWIVYAGETEYFNVIMNMNKFYPGSNILYLEATNRNSLRIERLSDSEIIQEIVMKLQKIYSESGVTVPTPAHYKISRFSLDPLFFGAWSNWPPGFTEDSHHALRAPVGRIYFAGEHTSMLHYGYLQGAYFSGVDTSDALDKCIQRSVCQRYVPIYAARGCRYTSASNYDHTVKQDDGSCEFPCVSSTDRQYALNMVVLLSIAALTRM